MMLLLRIFTCATNQTRGSKDLKFKSSHAFGCDNYCAGLKTTPTCAHRMASLCANQPDAPGFVTELQGGWFSMVTRSLSDDHYWYLIIRTIAT